MSIFKHIARAVNPTRPKTHRDVEFMVDDPSGSSSGMYFKSPDEAAGNAIARAMSHGGEVYIDVLVSSAAGARWYRGNSEGEDEYEDDPDASVFERIVVRADSQGRVA